MTDTSLGRRAVVALSGAVASIGLGAAGSATPTTDAGRDGEQGRGDDAAAATASPRAAAPADEVEGLVVERADAPVEATVDCLTDTIESKGLSVMTTVDHAANAAAVDRELPPTTLILFGNPAVGTRLMQDERTVGIDLPQKLLVWAADDTVRVAYNDPAYLADRHGIDDAAPIVSKVADALESIATADCCE